MCAQNFHTKLSLTRIYKISILWEPLFLFIVYFVYQHNTPSTTNLTVIVFNLK